MRQDILVFPDERLRIKSLPIDWDKFDLTEFDISLHDLMDTFWCAGLNAAGLSGIQINYPYRIFLMKNERGEVTVVTNPEIISTIGHPVDMPEGCLSFPGIYEKVPRYKEIEVKYDEVNPPTLNILRGKEVTLSGLEAHVFQHESEHLNGMVLVDKLLPAKTKTIQNKLTKWKTKGYIHPPYIRAN